MVLASIFVGCQVLKGKKTEVKDSTQVQRADSGQVKITNVERKDSLAWWREVLNFGRDTNIINPITNVYPTSYIREGGTQVIREREVNYDSLWNNKLDSLVSKLSTTEKSKETKVGTQWYIWAILGLLGFQFLSKYFKK